MSYTLEKKEKEKSLTYTSPKKKWAMAAVAAAWEEVDYFDMSYPLEKKRKSLTHTHRQKKLAQAAVAASWEEVEYFDLSYTLQKKAQIAYTHIAEKIFG